MAPPGWDSPSAVVGIHADLEAIALLFFAALVVFDASAHWDKKRAVLFERIGLICFGIAVISEIFAYPYSRRNDSLSESSRLSAEMRIADLNREAGEARRTAASAQREAGEANERAAGNEMAAALLHKRAEDEAMARVKIEARVAWRRLSNQQKAEIGAALARGFSNLAVSFWYSAGDTESSWFAADIAEAVESAHSLRIYPPGGVMTMMESGQLGEPIRRTVTGVTVQSTRDERSRQLADAIIHELTERGFDAARQTDPPFNPNPVPLVWVDVEPRPDGPQGEFKLTANRSLVVQK